MFQAIFKLMLLVPLLFTGALALVRAPLLYAAPVSDAARVFLLPAQDCAMPCWQGIQPGVTSIDQANALLSTNPWVENLRITERPPSTYLYWQWSAKTPAFVGDPRILIPPEMWGQDGVIQLIFLPISLTYGDVSLLLGAPHQGLFNVSVYPNAVTLSSRPNTHHLAVYFDGAVSFDTRIICPINLDLFWHAPVSVAYIGDLLVRSQAIFKYDLVRWLYRRPCKV